MMDVLINPMWQSFQKVCFLNYHVVCFKQHLILFVNFISIKLKNFKKYFKWTSTNTHMKSYLMLFWVKIDTFRFLLKFYPFYEWMKLLKIIWILWKNFRHQNSNRNHARHVIIERFFSLCNFNGSQAAFNKVYLYPYNEEVYWVKDTN